jgi:dihydrofolate synthase / folylpolyglutamate synthase
MSSKGYQKTIDWLFQQFPSYQNIGAGAYKPSLDNVLRLVDVLDISLLETPYIHIAGTNGKGSTCSMLASTLTEAGFKVGLFTSPHINDFRERIRVNGEMISQQSVIEFVNHVQAINLDIEPSFFEISFAMAVDHFNREKCDIAIIETGLGGRLDATNIITPILSVITNISLEHQNFLGNTRALIAGEKGGIIKPSIPVVFGQFDEEIAPVFSNIAEKNNAPLYLADSMQLNYLERNKVIVQKCLELLNTMNFRTSQNDFDNGILNLSKNSGLRGRMQIIGSNPLVIADAAHNTDGIKSLFNSINDTYPNHEIRIVYGSSSDKDLDQIGKLLPKNAQYFLTQFKNQRSLKEEDLKFFSQNFSLNAKFFKHPSEALSAAQESANERTVILVFGSFFLLEEIF